MKALVKKRIFDSDFEHHQFNDGDTIYEILEKTEIPKQIYPYLKVTVNGQAVYAKYWRNARPNKNTTVMIQVIPAGGDFGEFFKMAAVIAVTVVTAYATKGMGAGWTAGLTSAASLGASMALNAIFPPPVPSFNTGAIGSQDTKRIDVVTGQSNVVDHYGPCIRSYGRNRIYPRVAAQPYGFFIGDDSYLVTIYDLGIGDLHVEESTLKIGETSLSNFNNVDYRIVKNFNGDQFNYYTNAVSVENVAVEYKDNNDSGIRTTKANTDYFQIDVVFPAGLGGVDSAGSYVNNRVEIGLQYREVGTTEWKNYYDTKFDLDSRFSSRSYNLGKHSYSGIVDYSYNVDSGAYVNTFSFGADPSENRASLLVHYSFNTNRVKLDLKIDDQVKFFGKTYTVVSNDGVYSYLNSAIIASGSKRIVVHFTANSLDPKEKTYNADPFQFDTFDSYNFYNSSIVVQNNSNDRFIVSAMVYPELGPKQYEVRVTQTGLEKNGYNNHNFHAFTWGSLKSYSKTDPIKTKVPHTFLELKIKASEQLNGQVDNLSVEGISILDVYNADLEAWEKKQTSNPAWVLVDILTGDLNQRKIDKSKLHIDSIVKWSKYCDENTLDKFGNTAGFECNFVLDYKTTVRELAQQVCSVGRAALNIYGGSYGVIIDEEKTVPTQIFTPRNIVSFKSSKSFTDKPHGVKCRFISPMKDWSIDEVIAYNDGYTEENATLLEEIDVFACTSAVQAWRQGRYFLAQAELRQETIEIEVGIDNLSCTRGDLVRLAMDTMKAGGHSLRVSKVSGNFVSFDDDIVDLATENKQLEARHNINGNIIIHDVLNIVDLNTVEVGNASYFSKGDLVVFGEAQKTAIDLIVNTIDPDTDLNARLTLQEYAPAIFNADKGEIPTYEPAINNNVATTGKEPGAVSDVGHSYNVTCAKSENRYKYAVNLTWTPPASLVSSFEVYLTINSQTELAGIVKNNSFVYFADSSNLGKSHVFTIVSVSGTGEKLDLNSSTSYEMTPVQDTVAPDNVQDFSANILTERLELSWSGVSNCDLDKYIIKYFPETSDARWSISDTIAEVSASTTSKSVPLRNGTYLIKAVDWAGNYSLSDARVITTIPDSIDQYLEREYTVPVFNGKKINLQEYQGKLLLGSNSDFSLFNYLEGYYYFAEDIDLGDIYKVRFEASVVAGGFTFMSLMKNWAKLSDVSLLAGADFEGKVKAEVEIRVKADSDTLKDWVKLSDVSFLSYGTENSSGPWKKLTVGDYTGQKFQVRVKLSSTDNTLSPILHKATVKAYFPTRTITGKNAVSGTRFNFETGFKEIEVLNITVQENLALGDYYEIIEKDKDGFKVQFYDSSNTQKNTIKFDWSAVGTGVKYSNNDLIYK